MKKLLLIPLLILLSSCGYVKMAEVSQMSQSQLGNMSDDLFCTEARRFVILNNPVPVSVIREAQRRNLEYCIDGDQIKSLGEK